MNKTIKVITNKATKLKEFKNINCALKIYPLLFSNMDFVCAENSTRFEDFSSYNVLSN